MNKERNTQIETVLFPIEQKTLYLAVGESQQTELFDLSGTATHYGAVEGYKAIVDVERERVFAIVTDSYHLVTNEEAIKLGNECFRKIFSQTTAKSIEVYNIIQPKTRSFCHIDFMHQGEGFEPWSGDKWVPFLRVTNSYNRTKPLRFDVGFCRWICANGVIFGEQSITYSTPHTNGRVAETVKFKTSFENLKELEKKFIERLHNLQRYFVPQDKMLPLVCKALGIRATSEDVKKEKRAQELRKFREQVKTLTESYFLQLGPNGYAAFNVITDFASRPQFYISPEAKIDQLQKRSGDWATEFIAAMNEKSFTFPIYLGEFSQTADVLNTIA